MPLRHTPARAMDNAAIVAAANEPAGATAYPVDAASLDRRARNELAGTSKQSGNRPLSVPVVLTTTVLVGGTILLLLRG